MPFSTFEHGSETQSVRSRLQNVQDLAKDAELENDRGMDCFKQKRYESALEHYSEAIAL